MFENPHSKLTGVSTELPRVTPLHATDDAGISTSAVVTRVFEQVLESIHNGQLQPGEHINDTKLAEEYGVSRTPVREALQRLREIGVIEASANRFTRVAVVSPRETAEAMVVWIALFDALIDEVMPHVDGQVMAAMERHHTEFLDAMAGMDMQSAATANFAFFYQLTALSANTALRRAIRSVVHIVRLGGLHLPRNLDINALSTSQELFLDAVRAKDAGLAHEALDIIRGLDIPQ